MVTTHNVITGMVVRGDEACRNLFSVMYSWFGVGRKFCLNVVLVFINS